jgi:hypothetical protein
MSENINVCLVTDANLEQLRKSSQVQDLIIAHPTDSSEWLEKVISEPFFQEKKLTIENFELKTSPDGDYSNVEFENSVTLYEKLKKLPLYILTSEGFWAWINLTIGYKAAVQAMDFKKKDTFTRHWLFAGGKRRGIYFGVHSRRFFEVMETKTDDIEDPYAISRFVIEDQERIRNTHWRRFSNNPTIIRGMMKAEMDIFDKYNGNFSKKIYPNIMKYVNKMGGVMLLDVASESDIYTLVYNEMASEIENKEY